MIACYFLFFIILRLITLYFPGLDFERYEQLELLETLRESPWKFTFLAVVAAPLIEESLFRSLLKPTETSLKIFICAVLYLAGISLIPEAGHWILRNTLLFTSIFLCYYALGELIPPKIFRKVCYRLSRYYLPVWIGGSVAFGFVHIFNYVESFEINLVLFILIFPRIIAGFFFGKIKLENKGMIWPVLMHSMNNSIVLIFVIPYTLSHY